MPISGFESTNQTSKFQAIVRNRGKQKLAESDDWAKQSSLALSDLKYTTQLVNARGMETPRGI